MRRQRDRGAVSVYAVVAATAVVLVALVATEIAGLVAVRHRAASAADLAALAASRASVAGSDGCAAARESARRNAATVVRCRMDFDVATVTARATSRRWWGHRWAAEIPARAAPDFYLESAPSGVEGAPASTASSSRTAPALSSGSLALPHLGDTTQAGQPS